MCNLCPDCFDTILMMILMLTGITIVLDIAGNLTLLMVRAVMLTIIMVLAIMMTL